MWGQRQTIALRPRATASRALALQGKCQTACKPGSVPSGDGDDHSSGPAIADRFSRPTRTPRAVNPAAEAARRPYSVLLQAGLAMPPTLPPTRWALTPPFHPCRLRRAGGLLSVALSLGSPRAEVIRRLFTVEPGLSSTGRAPPRPPGRLARRQMGPRGDGVKFSLPFMGRDGEATPSPGGAFPQPIVVEKFSLKLPVHSDPSRSHQARPRNAQGANSARGAPLGLSSPTASRRLPLPTAGAIPRLLSRFRLLSPPTGR